MAELRFVSDQNMSAYVRDPPEKHSMFKSLVDGLILSPMNYAIMEHPEIIAEYIQSFWNTISEHTDANGTVSLIGKMGDEGVYPPTEKKLLHPYWRYLAHVVTQCLSGRKGGYDVLNQTLSSCMVALALGVDFNFSRMIFLDMHANIKGKRKERFLAFPRFIQIVINSRHKNLIPTISTLGVKRIREDIFGYMKMNKRGKKHTQARATAEGLVSKSSSSLSEEILIQDKEHVIPPLTRAEREDIQDADYAPTPESSPKKKRVKMISKRPKDPRLSYECQRLIRMAAMRVVIFDRLKVVMRMHRLCNGHAKGRKSAEPSLSRD
ncbi:hypothetical protein R6Q57_002138 [Mikania cordata]